MTRLAALTWYLLSLLGRSQAYLAPVLLFAAATVVLTTNDPGPLTGSYAAVALAQFVCLTWLTVTVVNTENTVQRAMTTVTAGSDRRVMLAGLLGAAVLCTGLTAVGLVYPILSGEHTVTPAAVAVGAVAQPVCGAAGIACGLVCSRPVVPRAGYAVVLALVADGAFVVAGLPPVGPVLRLLGDDRDPAAMLAPLAPQAAVAAALLAVSFTVALTVARRRA